MKFALLIAVMFAGATHAQDVIVWREKIDTRPFLVRLVLSVGFALEVGAEKARLKVDRGGADLAAGGTVKESLTVGSVIPESYAVTAKFGADF